jgi:hypothetical protein
VAIPAPAPDPARLADEMLAAKRRRAALLAAVRAVDALTPIGPAAAKDLSRRRGVLIHRLCSVHLRLAERRAALLIVQRRRVEERLARLRSAGAATVRETARRA